MKKTILLFLIISSFCSLAWSQKVDAAHPVHKMQWLVGAWQGTYNSQPFYEAWKKMNDSTLVNFVIEIKGTDTVIRENGVIRPVGNKILYSGRDAQRDIVEFNNSTLILINDTIKFANRIVWSHTEKDQWLAVIKNPKNTINYELVRVNWLDRYVDAFIKKATARN